MPVEPLALPGLGPRWAAWWRTNLPRIFFTFAVAVLVFSPVLLGNLQNPDSRWIGDLYVADHWEYAPLWESSQGRWALALVDALHGGLQDSMVLTRLPALLFFAVSAHLAVDLLGLRGRAARLLAPLVLVLNPCVYEILTYRYCCAAYGLSGLLGVAAVAAVVRLPGLPGLAVGACALMASLGLYQASLASASALCLMLCLLALLENPAEWPAVMRRFGRMALMGIAALAVYCAVLFANLALQGAELASYRGADSFGAGSLLTALPGAWVRTYLDTARFFAGHSIAANHYGLRAAYAVVLGLGALAAVALLWQKRRALGPKGVATVLVGAALLPPALNCMSLILPENVCTPRNMAALLLLVPFALALAEKAPALPIPSCNEPVRAGCAVAAAVLLWGSTLQCVTDAKVMTDRQTLYKTVAAHVYTDLTDAESYGTVPVLVVGNLPNENYPDPAKLADLVDFIATTEFSWPSSRTANLACWQNFYREDLGLVLDWCTVAQAYAVQESAEFSAMPCYPAAGSVATLTVEGEKILVCKVSEI